MKYYSIENCLDKKIMGKIPQVQDVIYNCDVIDEPKFIDHYFFREIKENPILANLSLYKSAKLTNFIRSNGGLGFSFGSMIISDKLKKIFEQFNISSLQYFPTFIMQNNQRIDGYWQTHKTKFTYEVIDFENSEIHIKNSENRKIDLSSKLQYDNVEDFQQKILDFNYPFHPSITKLCFIEDMSLDFFSLRYFENEGSYGIVSENLKNEIEKKSVTGIEFKPIELSLQEWYHNGEREKLYGKI